jgi:hypothetical protein
MRVINEHSVRSLEDAFLYLADCQLATVSGMALKKSRPAGEYKRQKSIAQKYVNWMRAFGVDPQGTRAEEVIFDFDGDVSAWATKQQA